jgi:hypothetical protein
MMLRLVVGSQAASTLTLHRRSPLAHVQNCVPATHPCPIPMDLYSNQTFVATLLNQVQAYSFAVCCGQISGNREILSLYCLRPYESRIVRRLLETLHQKLPPGVTLLSYVVWLSPCMKNVSGGRVVSRDVRSRARSVELPNGRALVPFYRILLRKVFKLCRLK